MFTILRRSDPSASLVRRPFKHEQQVLTPVCDFNSLLLLLPLFNDLVGMNPVRRPCEARTLPSQEGFPSNGPLARTKIRRPVKARSSS